MDRKTAGKPDYARWTGLLRVMGKFLCVGGFVFVLIGCNKPFHVPEHVTLTAPMPASKLLVRNQFGNVTIRADSEATEITAEVTKTGKGSLPGHATSALERIRVSLAPLEGDPETVVALAEHPRQSPWRGYEVKWRLTAPPDLAIEVHNDFGSIKARGFTRGMTLVSDFGSIEAEAAGPIELKTDFGDIELDVLPGVSGDIEARTDFGDVDVRLPLKCQGRLVAHTDFGDLDIVLEGMTVRLFLQRSRRVEAELGGRTEPKITLATDFGDVRIRCHEAEPSSTEPSPTEP